MYEIQSILLKKDKFSLQEAREWMEKHSYPIKKVDITKNYYRFRQHNPVPFLNYRTIELNNIGEIIIGYSK